MHISSVGTRTCLITLQASHIFKRKSSRELKNIDSTPVFIVRTTTLKKLNQIWTRLRQVTRRHQVGVEQWLSSLSYIRSRPKHLSLSDIKFFRVVLGFLEGR